MVLRLRRYGADRLDHSAEDEGSLVHLLLDVNVIFGPFVLFDNLQKCVFGKNHDLGRSAQVIFLLMFFGRRTEHMSVIGNKHVVIQDYVLVHRFENFERTLLQVQHLLDLRRSFEIKLLTRSYSLLLAARVGGCSSATK